MAVDIGLSFYETVAAAIRDIAEHGYDSEARLAHWREAIKAAAERDATPLGVVEDTLRRALGATYQRASTEAGNVRAQQGVARFTLANVRPEMRAELDKRIRASASLIRLNREQSIQRTMQRFEGWASSVPPGGSRTVDKREVRADLTKAFKSLPFEERRVIVDQGHKLTAAVNEVQALGNNAIAGEWRSHYKEKGYDYRPKHKARDLKVYAIRGSWAIERGLINKGAGYTDEIDRPAELPFCRCVYRYLFSLRDLPDEMLTQKGRDELERVRAQIRGMAPG